MMNQVIDLHPLNVDFEKWLGIFSKFSVGEATTIDVRELNSEDRREIRLAAQSCEILMGYDWDWGYTDYKQWKITRIK